MKTAIFIQTEGVRQMELKKHEEFLEIKRKIKEDWNDFDYVLSQVKQTGVRLYRASEELKNNEEIVKEAVKQNAWALEYASKKLQDNKEIVKIAVKQNGMALKFASRRLQDGEEIAREAIKQEVKTEGGGTKCKIKNTFKRTPMGIETHPRYDKKGEE